MTIMIQPNKYTDPDKAIISSSCVLLRVLIKKKLVQFDKLKDVLDKYNECASVLFLPAINLLFLLGVAKYHQKTDSFEYIGK